MRPGKGCFLMDLTIPVKKVRPGAVLPRRATAGSAGMDLCACLDAPVTIAPGERAVIPTGLAIALPAGHVGLIHPRSGLSSKHGITVANAPGTIDAGYRGEIRIPLINLDPHTTHQIRRGDRVAQLLIQKVETARFAPVTALDDAQLDATSRGTGGFGSTGGFAPAP